MDILFDLPLPEVPVFDMLSNTLSNYFTTACEYRISPLIFAINFCEVGILRFLLENGASSNFADNRGLTPLMHAVKKVRQKEKLHVKREFCCHFYIRTTQDILSYSFTVSGRFWDYAHLLCRKLWFRTMAWSNMSQRRIGIMCCGRVTCLFAYWYLVNYNIILNSSPNQSRVLIHITFSF